MILAEGPFVVDWQTERCRHGSWAHTPSALACSMAPAGAAWEWQHKSDAWPMEIACWLPKHSCCKDSRLSSAYGEPADRSSFLASQRTALDTTASMLGCYSQGSAGCLSTDCPQALPIQTAPLPGASLSNGLLARLLFGDHLHVLLAHHSSFGAAGTAAGLQETVGIRGCWQQRQERQSAVVPCWPASHCSSSTGPASTPTQADASSSDRPQRVEMEVWMFARLTRGRTQHTTMNS